MAPKPKSPDNLHEKRIVETLIQRLNGMIQKDPKLAKKAAIILETWMAKTRK